MRGFPLTLCWSRARSFKSPSKQQRLRLRRHFQRVDSAASGWFSDLCREPARDPPSKLPCCVVGSAGACAWITCTPRVRDPKRPFAFHCGIGYSDPKLPFTGERLRWVHLVPRLSPSIL